MADTYEITSQRQTTDLGPDGRFGDVMEITFQTRRDGIVGSVRIPMRQYSPETVAAAIVQYVDRIEGVQDL